MAKKKSSLSRITSKVASRKKRKKPKKPKKKNPSSPPKKALIANGGAVGDIGELILPAVGAYAATRLVGRIAFNTLSKKSSGMGKHAGVVAPLIGAGAVWFAAHKVDSLTPYHDQLVIGAGIAAIQCAVQTYLPRYGWIMCDYSGPGAEAETAKGPEEGAIATGDSWEVDEGTPVTGSLNEPDRNQDMDLSEEELAGFYSGSFAD